MFLINPYILQASGNPLWDGLQAYYTADNTPNDALGTYNGTLVNGATYGTGIINNGFSLDGVNDYVDFSTNWFRKSKTEPFTFSFWVNLQVDVTSTIFSNGVDYGHWAFLNTRYVTFQIGDDQSRYLRVRSTSQITLNTLTHVTVTYNGTPNVSGFSIYINGASDTVVNVTNILTSDTPLTAIIPSIGRRPGGNAYYFNGIIDEVGIWNRVLTSSEVTELYNSGAGKQYPN